MARSDYGARGVTTMIPLQDRQQCCWAVSNLKTLCEIAETTADCDNPDRKKHVDLLIEHDDFGNDWSILYEKHGDEEAFLSLKVTRSGEHALALDGSRIVLRSFIHLMKDGIVCPFRCYHSDIFQLNAGDCESWVMGSVKDMLDTFARRELKIVVHIEQADCSMKTEAKNMFKAVVPPRAKFALDLGSLLGYDKPSEISDFQVIWTGNNSESRTFYLNKAILSSRVPFLRNLFQGEMKESEVSSMLTKGFSDRTIELVFHLIYTGNLSLLEQDTIETLHELLDLSTKWEMEELKKSVDRNIVNYLAFTTANHLYELSRIYGLESGLRESSSFIFQHTDEIIALEKSTSPGKRRRSI